MHSPITSHSCLPFGVQSRQIPAVCIRWINFEIKIRTSSVPSESSVYKGETCRFYILLLPHYCHSWSLKLERDYQGPSDCQAARSSDACKFHQSASLPFPQRWRFHAFLHPLRNWSQKQVLDHVVGDLGCIAVDAQIPVLSEFLSFDFSYL